MASTDGVSVLFDVIAEGWGIQLFYNSHSLHRQRKKSSVHFHQLKHLQFSCFGHLLWPIITVWSVESRYHFIQMLNGPVDLPLRFIVVRVVESITLTKASRHQNTAVTPVRPCRMGLQMRRRLPQWQKSEETTKRLEGSARYLLSSFPYSCSLFSLRAPTRMGTILKSSLRLQSQTS